MNELTLKNDQICKIIEGIPADAQQLLDLSKAVIGENDFQVTTPEEFNLNLEQEEQWVEKLNSCSNSLLLVAKVNDEIVGLLDFHGRTNRRKIAHVGSFGMSVKKEYRGQGIGSALLNTIIQWGKEHPQIEKIGLAVLSNNENAITVYKRLGFIEEGRRINEIKLSDNEYLDDILMYINVKNA